MGSLQKIENKGIQTFLKCLEAILTIATLSYQNQVQEDQCHINLKKLSSEIMLGKATEDTAMGLDGKGATNFEQLKDLKKCDKRDCCYAALEEKYEKFEQKIIMKQSHQF